MRSGPFFLTNCFQSWSYLGLFCALSFIHTPDLQSHSSRVIDWVSCVMGIIIVQKHSSVFYLLILIHSVPVHFSFHHPSVIWCLRVHRAENSFTNVLGVWDAFSFPLPNMERANTSEEVHYVFDVQASHCLPKCSAGSFKWPSACFCFSNSGVLCHHSNAILLFLWTKIKLSADSDSCWSFQKCRDVDLVMAAWGCISRIMFLWMDAFIFLLQ